MQYEEHTNFLHSFGDDGKMLCWDFKDFSQARRTHTHTHAHTHIHNTPPHTHSTHTHTSRITHRLAFVAACTLLMHIV
jgi:hypothetical protein